MLDKQDERCPECDALAPADEGLSRRVFMKSVGGTAVTLAGLQAVPRAASPAFGQAPATPAQPAAQKPAEALVRELYSGLSDAQKRDAVFAWNHGATATQPTARLRFYNAAMGRQIGDVYTPAHHQLVDRILHSLPPHDHP